MKYDYSLGIFIGIMLSVFVSLLLFIETLKYNFQNKWKINDLKEVKRLNKVNKMKMIKLCKVILEEIKKNEYIKIMFKDEVSIYKDMIYVIDYELIETKYNHEKALKLIRKK